MSLDEFIEVPAHSRKKRGRKPLPEILPRVEVIHDIADDEKVCSLHGQALTPIGDKSIRTTGHCSGESTGTASYS